MVLVLVMVLGPWSDVEISHKIRLSPCSWEYPTSMCLSTSYAVATTEKSLCETHICRIPLIFFAISDCWPLASARHVNMRYRRGLLVLCLNYSPIVEQLVIRSC